MKYGYIYITTNSINGIKYIGQHKSQKFSQDYKGSGLVLSHAFKKYGKDIFKVELIEWCETREIMNEREKYYIKKFDAAKSKLFYNILEGGSGGNPFYGKSEIEIKEIKRKISIANSGENHPFFGKKHSEESRRKFTESRKGKKHSEETLEKMRGRAGRTGKDNHMSKPITIFKDKNFYKEYECMLDFSKDLQEIYGISYSAAKGASQKIGNGWNPSPCSKYYGWSVAE